VSRATPDGYTLLIANVSLVVNPYLYPKMPYDPLKDFVPITMVNSAPLLLVVHPSIAAKSVAELIAYAKAHPGQLNYGSGGLGSTPYLAAELSNRSRELTLYTCDTKVVRQRSAIWSVDSCHL
jgi:tripartite-type tricarboxylate transporter receptor subunit TctC